MDDVEREIERIDQGGDACDEDDEVVEVEIRRPLNIVVPVRLSSDVYDALSKRADQLGVGPGALIKTWVLEN
jgi:hypothetical protein